MTSSLSSSCLCANLLSSKYGFNPTDGEFILAGSRRIVDSEVPHKDFISFRTAGSMKLHAPFVALGGDYAIWVSRLFVWFKFAAIAWMWTVASSRSESLFSFSILLSIS